METYKVLARMIRVLLSMALVAAITCTTGCVTFIGYDGPYEGRVIDIETRQPIEGAVVHATWDRSSPGPGGATGRYYDSQETLTDKEGNFKIMGVGLLLLSNVEEPMINIFKTGYTQKNNYWSRFKIKKYQPDVDVEDDKYIFRLRRMTLEERRLRHATTPSTPTNKEIKLFMREENKENIEIGRPKDTLYPEEPLK